MGVSTTNCYDTNFNAHDQERHQTVTFSVYADGDLLHNENSKGLGCAPFDYDYDFAQQVELSWFRISANGSIDVLSINSGNTNVTITIKDDGGSAGGGLDTTTQTLFVIVLPVNDHSLTSSLGPVCLSMKMLANRFMLPPTLAVGDVRDPSNYSHSSYPCWIFVCLIVAGHP